MRYRYELNTKYKNKIRERVANAQEEVSIKLEHIAVQWVRAHFVVHSPNKIRGTAQGEQLDLQTNVKVKWANQNRQLELGSA